MPIDAHAAVLLLPEFDGGRILQPADLRWLCRGTVRRSSDDRDALDRVLALFGLTAPAEGRAALRYWGQTGVRPGGWVAQAEPVTLEVRLHDLFVHGPASTQLSIDELSGLITHLTENLAEASGFRMKSEQGSLYIFAAEPMPTHRDSADRAGRQSLRSMSGERAAADSILTEIEMLLHAAEVNVRREALGQPPINSLWLSGGGPAPAPVERDLPLLVADDPLFTGFWLSSAATARTWPDEPADFPASSGGGFVAVAPPGAETAPLLAQLRRMQARGALRGIDLLFRDGVHVELRFAHRFRLWRKPSHLSKVTESGQ